MSEQNLRVDKWRPRGKRHGAQGASQAPGLMVGRGFSAQPFAALVSAGLATAMPERMLAGKKPTEVTRVRITCGQAVEADGTMTTPSDPNEIAKQATIFRSDRGEPMVNVRVYDGVLIAALSAFADSAAAFEYSGFRIGMSEAEIFSAARQRGYQLRPTDSKENFSSYFWQATASTGGSGYVSLCNGRLFSAGSTFDANVHVFIGLIQERQNQYGDAKWKGNQTYSTKGQQLSTLQAEWDDPIGRFQHNDSVHL